MAQECQTLNKVIIQMLLVKYYSAAIRRKKIIVTTRHKGWGRGVGVRFFLYYRFSKSNIVIIIKVS